MGNDALRVMVVDDEQLARLRLKTLLSQSDCPNEVVAEAGDARQALAVFSPADGGVAPVVDLVLLDIQMPGPDGLRLAERLRSLANPPAVVFVTAHAGHALQAFELEALDYLTKPVRLDRLNAALARCVKRKPLAATPGVPEQIEEPTLVAQDRGRLVRVPASQVIYLKAELKYVTLRTAEHSHVLDQSLTELEGQLGDKFVRVHRNALVARSAMKALERRADDEEGGETWAVQVQPTGEWLAVSRRQVATVREVMAGR
ncbi:LytTR family DNA-binding domain-containing protein [Aquabacterium sp. CECT 9606]|jgi:two-component system response regulator AlgR|uniref:LytR/AlgR family response regulator transcription factor n=1 Tax=Aquabacterium sp. CECT 9606 TaxID=2845822 RepID=UPI001E43B6BF|nr:LytTR family DNA-binding domain-containing protein [Aquabacterium sp. CECT 9606]CAH0348645.1 Transcriptional regulatory protein YpdB [Aquabacterium sp. CECT 9606]